jgi:hypothetical protein
LKLNNKIEKTNPTKLISKKNPTTTFIQLFRIENFKNKIKKTNIMQKKTQKKNKKNLTLI